MSTDKSDLLRKIQGLLAKAEATTFEGERQVFMAKADELMDKYRIELWEIQQHEAGRIDNRTPIIYDMDYSFAFESGPFPDICDALWSLFLGVARHVNVVIVTHKQHYSGTTNTYKSYTVPVIGTESDMGYMTLLFTSLMTQLIESTHPTADKNKTYFENLRKFREAGWGWDDVGKVMQEAGFNAEMTREAGRDRMIRDYRRMCKELGVDQNYNHHKTFRRNFATGFVSEVDARLRAMRAQSSESLGTGLELALRDQHKINREFMFEQFPLSGATRGGSLVKDNRKYDSAAMAAGRTAGSKANITVNPTKGVRSPKRLGK